MDLHKLISDIGSGDLFSTKALISQECHTIKLKDLYKLMNQLAYLLHCILKKNADTPFFQDITFITKNFLRILEERLQTPDAEEEPLDAKRFISSIYMIFFYFEKKAAYASICELHLTCLAAVKSLYSIPNVKIKNKQETNDLANIFWITGRNPTQPSLELCCSSVAMLSIIPTNRKVLCEKLKRGVYLYGSSPALGEPDPLVQLFESAKNFAPSADPLTQAEERAEVELLQSLTVQLVKQVKEGGRSAVLPRLKAIKELAKQGCLQNSTLNAALAVFDVMASSSSTPDAKSMAACRSYLTGGGTWSSLVTGLLANLGEVTREGCKNAPTAVTREIQLLLFDSLPHSQPSELLNLVKTIVYLINSEVPAKPQEDPWKDAGRLGIEVACKAVYALLDVKSQLNDGALCSASNIFYKMSYIACILSLPNANDFNNSYKLYNTYFDHVFCFLSQSDTESTVSSYLENINHVAKNAMYVYFGAGDVMCEERAEQAILVGLRYTASLSQARVILSDAQYRQVLQRVAATWCDLKVRLASSPCAELLQEHPSLVSMWRYYAQLAACHCCPAPLEPNWEELLSEEIFAYPEKPDAIPPLVAAGRELSPRAQKVDDLMRWSRCTLAVSLAQGHEGEKGATRAVTLCKSVVEQLQQQLKGSPSQLECAIALMEAKFNLYLAEQKEIRKKNEKLADSPLLMRVPLHERGPGGESLAVEAWEEKEELSQLGSVLSCRHENSSMSILSSVLVLADTLLKKGISTENVNFSPALYVLECIAYTFSTLGNYWLALKSWSALFCVARVAAEPASQLLALSMLVANYAVQPDSEEEHWLEQTTTDLEQQLDPSHPKKDFLLKLYQLCRAKSNFLARKHVAAADAVIDTLSWDKLSKYPELGVRAHLLASQLMISLPTDCPQQLELMEEETNSLQAAQAAVRLGRPLVSASVVPERESSKLHRLDILLESYMWLGRLSILRGNKKGTSIALDKMLFSVQRYMMPTRVAQVLAYLGEIDLMTPNKKQLEQRLFWNKKILSMGDAIVGSSSKSRHRPRTPDASPTRCTKKKYQLTAACSSKCSTSAAEGCILCKNPLYQQCKAHYAFLVESNQDTFLRLVDELKAASVQRSHRLWLLTWGQLMGHTKFKTNHTTSAEGWLYLLFSPIAVLACRQKLIVAAMKAEDGYVGAAEAMVRGVKDELSEMNSEMAPLLLQWTRSQLAAILMQARGIGQFSSKLEAPPQIRVDLLEPSAPVRDPAAPVLGPHNVPATPRPNKQPKIPAVPKRPGRQKKLPPGVELPENVPTSIPSIVRPKRTKFVLPDSPAKPPAPKGLFPSPVVQTKQRPQDKENCPHAPSQQPAATKTLTAKAGRKTGQAAAVGTPSSPGSMADLLALTPEYEAAVAASVSKEKKSMVVGSTSLKGERGSSCSSKSPVVVSKFKRLVIQSDSDDSPIRQQKSTSKPKVNLAAVLKGRTKAKQNTTSTTSDMDLATHVREGSSKEETSNPTTKSVLAGSNTSQGTGRSKIGNTVSKPTKEPTASSSTQPVDDLGAALAACTVSSSTVGKHAGMRGRKAVESKSTVSSCTGESSAAAYQDDSDSSIVIETSQVELKPGKKGRKAAKPRSTMPARAGKSSATAGHQDISDSDTDFPSVKCHCQVESKPATRRVNRKKP